MKERKTTMKISANFSAETPYFVYIMTATMKRLQFYASDAITAQKKASLLMKQYGTFDFFYLMNAREG